MQTIGFSNVIYIMKSTDFTDEMEDGMEGEESKGHGEVEVSSVTEFLIG